MYTTVQANYLLNRDQRLLQAVTSQIGTKLLEAAAEMLSSHQQACCLCYKPLLTEHAATNIAVDSKKSKVHQLGSAQNQKITTAVNVGAACNSKQ